MDRKRMALIVRGDLSFPKLRDNILRRVVSDLKILSAKYWRNHDESDDYVSVGIDLAIELIVKSMRGKGVGECHRKKKYAEGLYLIREYAPSKTQDRCLKEEKN